MRHPAKYAKYPEEDEVNLSNLESSE